jgi:hypothetical protein
MLIQFVELTVTKKSIEKNRKKTTIQKIRKNNQGLKWKQGLKKKNENKKKGRKMYNKKN